MSNKGHYQNCKKTHYHNSLSKSTPLAITGTWRNKHCF